MVYLSVSDIERLKKIVDLIQAQVNANVDLDNKLELGKKFKAPLGESLALIEIFKHFKDSIEYDWYGGQKKDFDIILSKGETEVKIQIKTSLLDDYNFQISTHGYDNKLIEQLKNRNFSGLFKKIETDIDDKDVHFWIFVHIQEKTKFYITNNEQLKKVLKIDFQNYVDNANHRPNTRYGIDKNNSGRYIIKKSSGSLEEYEDKWNLINKVLT